MSPGPGQVRRVNPCDDPHWSAKIAPFARATFFHGAPWARVLCETYGFKPLYLIREERGVIQGVLPLMEVRSWLTGNRGISLPFTDRCATLGHTAQAMGDLARASRELAAERGWRYCELRGGTAGPGGPDAVSYFGHQLELGPEAAALFGRCASSTRRAVRKAEDTGVTVTFSDGEDDIATFYRLLCRTRRRHGLPPQPFRFFANIHRHVIRPGLGCIALARAGGVAVAGAVFFHHAGTALFKFGASDETFQHLRANNLVMWRAIEWHARAGFNRMDFGRTSPSNAGLRRFKCSWGAREHPIGYTRFDCTSARFVPIRDASAGWSSALFKWVPRPVARVIGALAYRHVA